MVINPWKAFLFLAGGTVASVGTAYVSGVLDPYLHSRPTQVAAVPEQDAAAPKAERLSAPDQPAAATVKPQDAPAPAAEGPIVPTFDVVRVEPDGSVVVAGKAEPNASVEMLAGEQSIGAAKADGGGDFAIILDKPLKPGDYQLSLRSTAPGAPGVASTETAIVSVPQTPNGQVLAMVETPGKASEVVTAPKAAPQTSETVQAPSTSAGSSTSEQASEPSQPSEPSAQPQGQQQAAATPSDASAGATKPSEAPSQAAAVSVQAVEIEGKKIFVAGMAEPGRSVRVYANEMLLGEAKVAPNGRFLVEAEHELPVGNYTIRADVLGDGGQVLARAAVPFEREPGEAVAAVAPPAATGVQPDNAAPKSAEPASQAAEAEAPGANTAEAGATVTTAPKLEPVASAVIIRRGDSLWRISKRVYGRGIRYSTIYLANQDQIANPDLIWPGQIFAVPEKTSEGEDADMGALGKQMTSRPGAIAR